jgi:hypothetical protein
VSETAAAALDAESAEWVRALAGTGSRREEATARLHGLLVRIALADAGRRGPRLRITGPELVPLDALVVKLASNRNAIYKMLFDARRKLRAALVANGYLGDDTTRRS